MDGADGVMEPADSPAPDVTVTVSPEEQADAAVVLLSKTW